MDLRIIIRNHVFTKTYRKKLVSRWKLLDTENTKEMHGLSLFLKIKDGDAREQVTALLNSVWNYVLVDIAKKARKIFQLRIYQEYRKALLARTPEVIEKLSRY
jgi:hypothetical protein